MSTRNLTRTLLLAAALMVALAPTSNAATPLFSSFVGPYQPITVSGLGTCSTARDGEVFLVTNATSSSVCTGTGSAAALCICDASAWRAIGGALAPTATLASTVTVADAAADTTTFPALAGSATGSLPVLTDSGLSYNASTNILTVTGGVDGHALLAGRSAGQTIIGELGDDSADRSLSLRSGILAATAYSKLDLFGGTTIDTTLSATDSTATGSLSLEVSAGDVITSISADNGSGNYAELTISDEAAGPTVSIRAGEFTALTIQSTGADLTIRVLADAPSVCDASTSVGDFYIDSTGNDWCFCPGAAGWLPADGSGTCA